MSDDCRNTATWPGSRRQAAGGMCLAALLILTAACGGSSARPGTARPPSKASSASAAAQATTVTAEAAGRKLQGHCRGSQQDLPAVLLESGLAAGEDQLTGLEDHLASRTMVCAYNRAGVGDSDPVTTRLPRSLEELVTDLNTFADATHARSPYLLAGQSMGANIVFRYAQRYPGKVAGFVAMNPVPPEHTYLSRVRSVESRDEYAAELAFYRGENDERVDFATSEKQLTEPLPKTLRFIVMFDEDCDGDTEFCGRILPVLTRTTRELASRGAKGTFVPAPGAGHQIYAEQPQLVADTVDSLLSKH